MVPKASIDIDDTFYLVLIHNYSEYMLVANDDLSIYKNIIHSYKVMDKVEYYENKNNETE